MSKSGYKTIPSMRFPTFVNEGEWETKSLGSVAEVITGNTPSTTNPLYYGGDKLFVSPADINYKRYLTHTKTTLTELGYSQTRHIKANSVLFVCIGSTIGKVAQTKFDCATNQQINSLVANDDYSNDFLYSLLEYQSSKIASIAGNHAVPLINKSTFAAIELAFPKIEEQQKIADCLSSLDCLIIAQNQKIKLLENYKKGLMEQLIPSRNKLVPTLRFPDFQDTGDWEEKQLSELGNLVNGLTYSPEDIRGEGLLVLRSSNVQNGQLVLDDRVYVKPEISGANLVKEKDILVCIRNGSKALIGKNALIPKDMPLATHGAFMAVFRAKFPDFVFQLFQTKIYVRQVNADLGATINSINGTNFLKYKFIVPRNPSEQQKVADCLSSLDSLIIEQNQKLDVLKEHKKGLMEQLFPKIF